MMRERVWVFYQTFNFDLMDNPQDQEPNKFTDQPTQPPTQQQPDPTHPPPHPPPPHPNPTQPSHHPPTSPNRFLGRFFWKADTPTEDLDLAQEQRLKEIVEFYDDEVMHTMFLPIISKKDDLSLREIDWAVTNFTKKNPVIYKAAPFQHIHHTTQDLASKEQVAVNIHADYKKWLSNFKRRSFDMFRRGKRIFFKHDGQVYSTTVGQLNFFHWAERYGVLSYIRSNLQQIKTDHIVSTKRTHEQEEDKEQGKKRRRRRELSQAPKSKCFVYNMSVSVSFD
ncbi:MAG: hypothetical protein K0U52_12775 [Gammaproteobacteria bacterium]|nr:hypothetical protein [Gammaproteobacteria bacterium]